MISTGLRAGQEEHLAERNKNIRQELILAGIQEINENGVTGFSIRRVAEACNVSCAAPYRHFKDKREFIAAIIGYVNEQWRERQVEVLDEVEKSGGGIRQKIVAVLVQYIRFLMDKPSYRSILLLKDDQFDNIYHKMRGQLSSQSQLLEQEFFAQSGMDAATQKRKLFTVRALMFGAIFMFDTGELVYNDETMKMIEYTVDREFDMP